MSDNKLYNYLIQAEWEPKLDTYNFKISCRLSCIALADLITAQPNLSLNILRNLLEEYQTNNDR